MSETGPAPERAEYYGRVGASALAPLWEQVASFVTPEPKPKCRAHLWPYGEYRPLLLESGEQVSLDDAERRVLALVNPGMAGMMRATDDLFCGLQLILPGEVAWTHRHNITALRFIIEGSGGFTRVEGEKTYMEPGDLIITRNWSWHDHGHEGDGPMIWMDGLDLPITLALGTSFVERGADAQSPETAPAGFSSAQFGANMRPVGHRSVEPVSPILNYPYVAAREALEAMAAGGEWDPWFGLKLEYTDPTTGGPAMPTMSTHMQLLPKGFTSERYQTTDGAVYSVVEGRGKVIVGDGEDTVTLDWGPRDAFVIPHWQPHRFEAADDSFLFSFSDKAAQEKLGLWREVRGNL